MDTNSLITLYRDVTGSEPTDIEGLAASGSNRRYYRLRGVRSLVGVLGTSCEENIAFIELARHFGERGLHRKRASYALVFGRGTRIAVSHHSPAP